MQGSKNNFPVFLLDLVADLLAVTSAYFATYFLRFHTAFGGLLQSAVHRLNLSAGPTGFMDYASFYFDPVNAFRIILLLSLTVCSLNAFFGLYSGRRFLQTQYTVFQMLKVDGIALLLFVSYLYLSRNQFHPRSMFLTLMVLHFLFAVLYRKSMTVIMNSLRRGWGIDRHPVLLAGDPALLDGIEGWLQAVEPHGLFPARRVAVAPGLAPGETAARLVKEAWAEGADTICCADSRLDISTLMELLDRADANHLAVKIASSRLDILLHQARIESDTFKGVPLIHFSPTSDFAAIQRIRRIGSVLFSIAFIILASPLFLAVALLVKLTSRGPVWFVQERVGWDGRPFRMFKFRTMYVNAEKMKETTERDGTGAVGLFKVKRDPRVTPVGRFFRKFSLDELPQFFNVLRGEMNVVGPRPLPREDFQLYYEPWHHSRHKGQPGITGLWQVSGRSDLTFEQMCVLDVYYLHNASLSLDVRILFRTVVSILFAEGAY